MRRKRQPQPRPECRAVQRRDHRFGKRVDPLADIADPRGRQRLIIFRKVYPRGKSGAGPRQDNRATLRLRLSRVELRHQSRAKVRRERIGHWTVEPQHGDTVLLVCLDRSAHTRPTRSALPLEQLLRRIAPYASTGGSWALSQTGILSNSASIASLSKVSCNCLIRGGTAWPSARRCAITRRSLGSWR